MMVSRASRGAAKGGLERSRAPRCSLRANREAHGPGSISTHPEGDSLPRLLAAFGSL